MDVTPIVDTFPQVLPYLGYVPLVQMGAAALANIPRLWGVTHETVWSRLWRRVASFPLIYTPKK